MFERRPRRAPTLRRPGDFSSGSWLLPALLVLLAHTTATSASATVCCPENTSWLNPNCSDGSHILLHCQDGFYMIDPSINHFDEFRIVENGGSYLEFLHEYHSIPPDRYCISGKNETKHPGQWALACFSSDETFLEQWKYTVFGILCIISAIFLFLTLTVYLMLPELRDTQGKVTATSVTFLAWSYVLLAILQTRMVSPEGHSMCISLGFVLYWTLLSAFFWMNLVAFNVWRSVWFKHFPIKDNDLFLVYCGVGFVGPGFFLIAALVAHHTDGNHLKPHFGENGCWFSGIMERWAFFCGPIAVLLALNVIYLGLTCWRLWFEYRRYTGSALRTLRFNCLLYVKLAFLMGISWVFEVISYAVSRGQNEMYWFATDILNTLQGLIIFLLLVATRKRVKRLLARKQPCGISFPKSWAAYDEEDENIPSLEVEMALSHSP